jgi:hypothetical protein
MPQVPILHMLAVTLCFKSNFMFKNLKYCVPMLLPWQRRTYQLLLVLHAGCIPEMSETLPLQPRSGETLIHRASTMNKDTEVEQVRVVVRCRPPSSSENESPDCCSISKDGKEVSLNDGQRYGLQTSKIFTFDAAYGGETTQEEVCNPFLGGKFLSPPQNAEILQKT